MLYFCTLKGLVDYTYLNPMSKQEEPKTTYIQRVDDLIICCGAYKLPESK